MEEYIYENHTPVQDGKIRLLKLLPGKRHTDLEANLEVRWIRRPPGSEDDMTVKDPEDYEALSYHWGNSKEEDKMIKILANSQSYFINIKPNLDCALRHLRYEGNSRFLWIDALCINQGDSDEKTIQVVQMSLIYSRARSVAVWLGEGGEDSKQAIEFIPKCLNLDDFDSLVRDPKAPNDWAALSELMRRPWFNRRWIIQEIATAKDATIYCGDDEISWRDFADAISLFASKETELRRLFRKSDVHRNHPDYLGDLRELGAVRLVAAADDLFRKSEKGEIMGHTFSLEAVMSSMSAFEASKPHDILYAVLWLANDAHPVAKGIPHVMSHHPQQLMTSTTNSPVVSPMTSTFPGGDTTIGHGESYIRAAHAPLIRGHGESHIGADPPPLITRQDDTTDLLVDRIASEPVPVQADAVELSGPSRIVPLLPNDTSTISSRPTSSGNRPTFLTGEAQPAAEGFELGNQSRRISDAGISEDTKKRIAIQMWKRVVSSRRVVVDYKKDVFEVCKDFLEFIVKRSLSLDMLCRPWAPDDCNLPSWVPTLSRGAFSPGFDRVHRRVNADPLVGEPGRERSPYAASKGMTAVWFPKQANKRAVRIQGFILDTIFEKKSPAAGGIVPLEWIAAGGWKNLSDLPPDRFWRTLVGNRNKHGRGPPAHWCRVCRDAFSRKPARGDLNTREIINYDCPSAVREFLERVQGMVWSRRLVTLRSSRESLALVPANSKKTDLICILYGCSVPVVLRKYAAPGMPASKQRKPCPQPDCPTHRFFEGVANSQQSNGVSEIGIVPDEHYEFIGEAYVHGMMDGEAFNVKREKKLPNVDFELR